MCKIIAYSYIWATLFPKVIQNFRNNFGLDGILEDPRICQNLFIDDSNWFILVQAVAEESAKRNCHFSIGRYDVNSSPFSGNQFFLSLCPYTVGFKKLKKHLLPSPVITVMYSLKKYLSFNSFLQLHELPLWGWTLAFFWDENF